MDYELSQAFMTVALPLLMLSPFVMLLIRLCYDTQHTRDVLHSTLVDTTGGQHQHSRKLAVAIVHQYIQKYYPGMVLCQAVDAPPLLKTVMERHQCQLATTDGTLLVQIHYDTNIPYDQQLTQSSLAGIDALAAQANILIVSHRTLQPGNNTGLLLYDIYNMEVDGVSSILKQVCDAYQERHGSVGEMVQQYCASLSTNSANKYNPRAVAALLADSTRI